MNTDKVQTTLSSLTSDIESFKNQQIERLQKLEHKFSCNTPLSDDRPGFETKSAMGNYDQQQQRVFETFLRKGDYGSATKSLSRGEDPGSYLIPHPVQERIIRHLSTTSSFRSIARIMNISGSNVEVIMDQKLPNVGWVGESEDRAETDTPGLVKINIPIHELYAKPKSTQALLDDAALNLEEWLVQKVSEKMLRAENESFVSGDGNKKPKGFLSYETVSSNDWSWGKLEHIKTGVDGAFQKDSSSDAFIDLMELLKTEYLSGSSWLMSRSAHAVIRKLTDNRTGSHLWQPSFSEGSPSTLLGYPVMILDEMPALVPSKVSKSIAFGNFKEAYQIVDRLNMHVLRDPYSSKPYVEFYVTKRVGGDVINFEAIKVLNFSA